MKIRQWIQKKNEDRTGLDLMRSVFGMIFFLEHLLRRYKDDPVMQKIKFQEYLSDVDLDTSEYELHYDDEDTSQFFDQTKYYVQELVTESIMCRSEMTCLWLLLDRLSAGTPILDILTGFTPFQRLAIETMYSHFKAHVINTEGI